MTKTEREMQSGLVSWVQAYRDARFYGNIRLAKQLQKSIDKEIERRGLDRGMVYFPSAAPMIEVK